MKNIILFALPIFLTSGCGKSPSNHSNVSDEPALKTILAGLETYADLTNRFGPPRNVLEMEAGRSNLYFFLKEAELEKLAERSIVGFSVSMANGVIRSTDPITRSGGPLIGPTLSSGQHTVPSLQFKVVGKSDAALNVLSIPMPLEFTIVARPTPDKGRYVYFKLADADAQKLRAFSERFLGEDVALSTNSVSFITFRLTVPLENDEFMLQVPE